MTDDLRQRARRWFEPADQWRAKVQHWVDAGIVSSSQAQEILAIEKSESPRVIDRAHDAANGPTLLPVVELLSYVGVIVVLVSSVLFLSHYWSGVGIAGHLSVSSMVAVAGLLGGYVVAQIGDAGSRRLSGFLRLLGTGGAAMTTAVVVDAMTASRRDVVVLCVGAVVLVVSVALWRNLNRPLQFLSGLFGLVLMLSGLGTVAHLNATSTEVALLVWFLAVAIGLMSLQMLRPAPTALVVAELGSFVGAFALSFPNHLAGVLLGLLTTLTAVAVGFALERPPIIVVGALGFFMFDFRIFAVYLRSPNAALGAFILGLVLILVALLCAMRMSSREPRVRAQRSVVVEGEWCEPS